MYLLLSNILASWSSLFRRVELHTGDATIMKAAKAHITVFSRIDNMSTERQNQ